MSKLESDFAFALKAIGCEMVREYQFHPTRKWRLDFASVAEKVGVEVDGGEFINGGGAHNRGVRMANDYEKRNAAIELGWAIFQLTGAMVKNDPVGWAKRVKAVIERR